MLRIRFRVEVVAGGGLAVFADFLGFAMSMHVHVRVELLKLGEAVLAADRTDITIFLIFSMNN